MKNGILLLIVLCMVFTAGCSGIVKEPSETSIDKSSAEDDNSDNYESSSDEISDDNSTEQSSVSNDELDDDSEDETSNDENSNNSEDETSMDDTSIDDTSVDNGNSEKEVKTPFVEYGYKLFVNGEEIEMEEEQIFCNENGIMLSFVTLMTALDAEFEWQSDTFAKMYWADMSFDLDSERCSLLHDEDPRRKIPWIAHAVGETHYITLEKDLLVQATSLIALFSVVRIDMTFDYDGRSVYINTTSEYPRKLTYGPYS